MKYLEKRNKNLITLLIFIILGVSLFFFWTRMVQELKVPADGYFNISLVFLHVLGSQRLGIQRYEMRRKPSKENMKRNNE